ncbi:MAG TPA: hypothetical protein VFW33_19875 [Gemmataceae bacterium]|nr:hypothetical protein [Gemmataceae bacterium]
MMRRLPRWFLGSAAGVMLATTVAAALLAGAWSGGDTSRAAYERVKIGMARPEAEAALGDWPHEPVRAGARWVTVAWEVPDGGTIEVDFDARGRVTGKHVTEADTSLAGRARRLLRHLPLP